MHKSSMMTDESLMLRIKDGHLGEAAVLYEKYKNRLFRFYMFRTYNNKEESEDGVQQVFYRIIRYRHSYKEGQSFLAWMFAIAQNVHVVMYSRSAKHDSMTSATNIGSYFLHNDNYEVLHMAIEMLPDNYKDVIVMSKLMDMKYEEIATVSNCSVGVIKTRVFRAMKLLRENYFKIN